MKKNFLLLLLIAALTEWTAQAASASFNSYGDEDHELIAAAGALSDCTLHPNALRKNGTRQSHSAPEAIRQQGLQDTLNYPDLPTSSKTSKAVATTQPLSTNELRKIFFGLRTMLLGDTSFNFKNSEDPEVFEKKFLKKLTKMSDGPKKRKLLMDANQVMTKEFTGIYASRIAQLDSFFTTHATHTSRSSFLEAKTTDNIQKINQFYSLFIEQPTALQGKALYSSKNCIVRYASAPEAINEITRRKSSISFGSGDELERVREFETDLEELNVMHTQWGYYNPNAAADDEIDDEYAQFWTENNGAGAFRAPHYVEIAQRDGDLFRLSHQHETEEQELDSAQETAESAVLGLFE